VPRLQDFPLFRFYFFFGDGTFQLQEIIGLCLNDVTSKRSGQRGMIRLHIEHVFDWVAEVTDAGLFKVVQDHCDITPLRDFLVCLRIIFKCAKALATAVCDNCVLVAMPTRIQALDLDSGRALWTQALPAAPVPWGLAVDCAGRVIVSLEDGRVLCFGPDADVLRDASIAMARHVEP